MAMPLIMCMERAMVLAVSRRDTRANTVRISGDVPIQVDLEIDELAVLVPTPHNKDVIIVRFPPLVVRAVVP